MKIEVQQHEPVQHDKPGMVMLLLRDDIGKCVGEISVRPYFTEVGDERGNHFVVEVASTAGHLLQSDVEIRVII